MTADSSHLTDSEHSLSQFSDSVVLGPDTVGPDNPVYFIAEIGNNNGDFFLAKNTIEEAARAGADAVKFQKRSVTGTFARELLDRPQTLNAIYGKTYGDYRRRLELDSQQFSELQSVAEDNKVSLFATPFDQPSVEFLEKLDMPFYKVSSFDVTNIPLLDAVAGTGKPVILSTGMADADEVCAAVDTITRHHGQLILLHCVSVYPSPDSEINLGMMRWLKNRFHPLPVGYSGHEPDILPTLAAIAQGARVVERHLTLSRTLPGPDHGTVSIEPPQFREMVDCGRRIESFTGLDTKRLLDSEIRVREKHGKSAVSAMAIPQGTQLQADMLTFKSPGYGLKPGQETPLLGKTAVRDIEADSVLLPEDFE